MMCELCGRDIPYTETILIDGVFLRVCPECTRFGEKTRARLERKKTHPTVSEGLIKRKKRMKTKDVYNNIAMELVLDYPQRIRSARNARGWKQEELGKRINEKKSVINKLETCDMRPDDKLVKKLEKTLGICLREKIEDVSVEKKKIVGYTLGDLINEEKE